MSASPLHFLPLRLYPVTNGQAGAEYRARPKRRPAATQSHMAWPPPLLLCAESKLLETWDHHLERVHRQHEPQGYFETQLAVLDW